MPAERLAVCEVGEFAVAEVLLSETVPWATFTPAPAVPSMMKMTLPEGYATGSKVLGVAETVAVRVSWVPKTALPVAGKV